VQIQVSRLAAADQVAATWQGDELATVRAADHPKLNCGASQRRPLCAAAEGDDTSRSQAGITQQSLWRKRPASAGQGGSGAVGHHIGEQRGQLSDRGSGLGYHLDVSFAIC
jgi:hypothetical protein